MPDMIQLVESLRQRIITAMQSMPVSDVRDTLLGGFTDLDQMKAMAGPGGVKEMTKTISVLASTLQQVEDQLDAKHKQWQEAVALGDAHRERYYRLKGDLDRLFDELDFRLDVPEVAYDTVTTWLTENLRHIVSGGVYETDLPYPETYEPQWRQAVSFLTQGLVALGWEPKESATLKEEVEDACAFLESLYQTKEISVTGEVTPALRCFEPQEVMQKLNDLVEFERNTLVKLCKGGLEWGAAVGQCLEVLQGKQLVELRSLRVDPPKPGEPLARIPKWSDRVPHITELVYAPTLLGEAVAAAAKIQQQSKRDA